MRPHVAIVSEGAADLWRDAPSGAYMAKRVSTKVLLILVGFVLMLTSAYGLASTLFTF